MAYELYEQFELDINWYFRDRFNHLCVATSAGGVLPEYINVNIENNDEFHQIIDELPEKFKIKRNERIVNRIQGLDNEEEVSEYFKEFEKLARKGLYVFDKFDIDNPDDPNYFLIVYPIYNRIKDTYPIDKKLLSMIPRTSGSINKRFVNPFNLKQYFLRLL
tara:strand:- start:18 stop:503 length:486 start_codon:yes stop_codon:yes gene_type:complete